MPQLAIGADEVTAQDWIVAVGDSFGIGQVLLEIETDKAIVDVEAPFAGTLLDQLCQVGDVVAVGALIGHVAEPDERLGDARAAVEAVAIEEQAGILPASPPTLDGSLGAEVASVTPRSDQDRALVTFVAAAHGELAGLPAAQDGEPGGAALRAPAAAVMAPISALDDRDAAGPHVAGRLSGARRAIGRRMSYAAAIPTFTVMREVPSTAASAVKAARAEGVAASFTDILLQACAAATVAHPQVNAWLDDDELVRFERVNVALAVDRPSGVIAPVLTDVRSLSLTEIAEARKDLVMRARDGAIHARELAGATITLSNIGGMGAHVLIPVITPPQVAILGVGAARSTPVGPLLMIAFVGDHRALDGADGARYLATLAHALEAP